MIERNMCMSLRQALFVPRGSRGPHHAQKDRVGKLGYLVMSRHC